MVPLLRDGDTVLVRHGARFAVGDVVLARFRAMPERLVLKRVSRAMDDGWWLTSDNGVAGGDSSVHGVADVDARVVLRLRRGARLRPWWPRRMRAIATSVDVADSGLRANPD